VNPFQYADRESDSETRLYYDRARYDTNTRRFTSEDPAGGGPVRNGQDSDAGLLGSGFSVNLMHGRYLSRVVHRLCNCSVLHIE
jgi:hypothetical protein